MSESVHLKYLAVNPGDLSYGTGVNSVGFQKVGAGEPYPPLGHPQRYLFSTANGRVLSEYQLLYITEGRGVFCSEATGLNNVIPVSRGSAMLLFPGVWHNYHPAADAGWKEYWIGFSGFAMDSKVRGGFFSPETPVLQVGMHDSMVSLYEEAIAAASEQKSGFQQLLSGIVEDLLGKAYCYDRNAAFSRQGIDGTMETAKALIASRLDGESSPREIAAELCMSYSNFRRYFRQYTGFSPSQYIRLLRMNRVKEMLTNTSVSVKEVAFRCGYVDYCNFLTSFRKLEGMTPSQYRAMTKSTPPHVRKPENRLMQVIFSRLLKGRPSGHFEGAVRLVKFPGEYHPGRQPPHLLKVRGDGGKASKNHFIEREFVV